MLLVPCEQWSHQRKSHKCSLIFPHKHHASNVNTNDIHYNHTFKGVRWNLAVVLSHVHWSCRCASSWRFSFSDFDYMSPVFAECDSDQYSKLKLKNKKVAQVNVVLRWNFTVTYEYHHISFLLILRIYELMVSERNQYLLRANILYLRTFNVSLESCLMTILAD